MLHPGTGDGATVGGIGEGRVCSDVDNARSLSLSLSDILTNSLSTPLNCYLILQMSTL